jgi:hypothetical protein
MEQIFPYITLTGLGLLALGYLILMVVAFRVRWWWGLLLIIPSPAALVFVLRHSRPSVVPATSLFVGVLMVTGPPVIDRFTPVDLGPRERIVKGELHLTLTGWDRKDYSVLRKRPHAVVLQMANPDVDDRVLDYLTGMDRLRELDLSDTKVTDAGLKALSALSKLETLWLCNTQVTDDGFRASIGRLASLKQLDLSGTRVSHDAARAWKEAGTARKVMQ